MAETRAYLQLVRLPGVFTAMADITAGYLLAGAPAGRFDRFLLVLAASSCFYAAGMALNDFFDYRTDLRERPQRPLPAGLVERESALWLGALLLAGGLVLALGAGRTGFRIGLILAFFILGYDAGLKNYKLLGPLVMGGCRCLNLLLGLSVLPLPGWAYIVCLIPGCYIAGITVLSREETTPGRSWPPLLAAGGGIFLAAAIYAWQNRAGVLYEPAGLIACLAWAACLLGLLFRSTGVSPAAAQRKITLLLLGLVILDGILAAGRQPFLYAVPVWLLLAPAVLAGRRLYLT